MIGATIVMGDGFCGLCDYAHLSLAGGERVLDLRLINYDSGLLGAGV